MKQLKIIKDKIDPMLFVSFVGKTSKFQRLKLLKRSFSKYLVENLVEIRSKIAKSLQNLDESFQSGQNLITKINQLGNTLFGKIR